MAAAHTFLDILANPQVRDAYLAGRITLVFSRDLATILWANGAGARFMGFATVADSINVTSRFDPAICEEVEAGLQHGAPVRISGQPWDGEFLVNTIIIEQLGPVVFLRSVGAAQGSGGVDLTEGLSDETTEAAVLDLSGQAVRSSAGFDPDWFDTGELAALLREAHADGGVKKRFLAKNSAVAVGVLRLSVAPALFLLIAARPEAGDKQSQAAKESALTLQEREAFSAIARHLQADIFAAAPPASREDDVLPVVSVPAVKPVAARLDEQGAPDPAAPLLLAQLPLPVLIYRDNDVLFANQAFLTLTGYETVEAFCQVVKPAAQVQQWSMLNEIITPAGLAMPVSVQRQSVIWQDGHSAMMGSFISPAAEGAARVEKSERDTAEVEMLKDRTIELSALLNMISDGVFVVDGSGVVASVNETACRMFGFTASAMRGQPFHRYFSGKSVEIIAQALATAKISNRRLAADTGQEVDGITADRKTLKLHIRLGQMEKGEGYFLLIRDLTPVHNAVSGLLRERYQAEEASWRKSRCLALVSDEISPSLNAIVKLAHIMLAEQHGSLGNESYRKFVQDILRAGQHITARMKDVQQVLKKEEAAREPEIKPVSLVNALNEVVGQMMPQANANRIIIRSGLAADLPAIAIEQQALRQIFVNLLSNAIRFTPQGGQIVISAYHQAEVVLLRIRDTGIGMTADEINRVMQSDPAATGQQSGSGLRRAKALAAANQTRFTLHSEPGKGTVAELVFRVA